MGAPTKEELIEKMKLIGRKHNMDSCFGSYWLTDDGESYIVRDHEEIGILLPRRSVSSPIKDSPISRFMDATDSIRIFCTSRQLGIDILLGNNSPTEMQKKAIVHAFCDDPDKLGLHLEIFNPFMIHTKIDPKNETSRNRFDFSITKDGEFDKKCEKTVHKIFEQI